MAFWTTAGKARSREIEWTVSSPKNSTTHSWRPSWEDARGWVWMQDLRMCLWLQKDLKASVWSQHNQRNPRWFQRAIGKTQLLPLKMKMHITCSLLLSASEGASGNAGVLCRFYCWKPVWNQAGAPTEEWDDLPFEFWTRGLALSLEKPKNSISAHVYCVCSVKECSFWGLFGNIWN